MSLLNTIHEYENIILTFFNEGQHQNDKYRPYPKGLPGFGPTYSFPFVPLEQALFPIGFYIALILFGLLFMREGRQMLSKETVYPLKFVYNFIQVFLCGYMTVEALFLKYRYGIPLYPFSHKECAMFDGVNPRVANLLWLFYVSKILDFADTFFIVVGGKVNQFSFLHVYHHLSVFM
ncbi:putative microsomal very long chain fatty acid elongase [Reticulomyxa filosa]|uniref:Elongation of fatty acids protein n=1 Tax=Reticulomyxa filosa TaxID=46433 RepID=X6N658_RETFI|nr:putative microsomal very long chain fatty acid elongase [Reticulomyxa filosa]|eukprot:ETO21388.1 putative microsomal very long chain fatty acid elongase [Reticulomyxa filosa]